MSNPDEHGRSYYTDDGNANAKSALDDTWQWWNKFRMFSDYNPKIRVSNDKCLANAV